MPKGIAIEGQGCWMCGALTGPHKEPWDKNGETKYYTCMSDERIDMGGIIRLKNFPNNRKLKCFEEWDGDF